MADGEAEFEIAQRQVLQGRTRVARLREIVAERRARRLPTQETEDVLARLQELQASHEAHLKQLA